MAKDDLARIIAAEVREGLDLGEIGGTSATNLGQPPFDPRFFGGAAGW